MAETESGPGSMHPWVAEGIRRVRFGIGNGPREDWPALREFVARAEEAGLDSYSLPDHPMVTVDGWTTMAAVAAVTRTIRPMVLVSCVHYRNPVVLARMAADVDRISDGRLVLGLGSGNRPTEYAQLGLPYPPTRERQAALEEGLRIVRPLLRGETVSFEGRYFQADGAVLRPPPIQRPYVPIVVAGGGERTTLRFAAQYADASNVATVAGPPGEDTDAVTRHKLDVLRGHCADFGRPYDAVLRTAYFVPTILAETPADLQAKIDRLPGWVLANYGRRVRLFAVPDDAVAWLRRLVEVGLRYFMLNIYGNDTETVDLLVRRVIPAVSA